MKFKGKMYKSRGITLIALIITIIVLLILAGVTISQLTGSESAPAKGNEASQKNDIGTAKDDVQLTAINAQTKGYEVAYLGTTISAGDSSKYVGKTVVQELYRKYGSSKQMGKATVSVTPEGSTGASDLDAITGGYISIYTTDFELVGEVVLDGGTITWEEIVANVPATVDRVELSPTTLEIEQDGSATIEISFYNSSNNLIPIRKLGDISISKTSGSDKISVTQDTTNRNKATIAVDLTETTGDKDIVITTSANGNSFNTNVTVTVTPKEAMVGQFVEYNVGYIDISTNSSGEPNNFEFTPSNGWRILDTGTEDIREGHSGEYIGAKIISTGVPAGLYYSKTETNNSWWGDGTKIKDKVANGLSTPSKFETIVFNKKTATEAYNDLYKNQGYYTQIKHYTSNTTTVINTNGKTVAELFKISNVAEEVDTLTLRELNIALNAANNNTARTIGTDNSDTDEATLRTSNDPRSLFDLRGLSTYSYATNTQNWAYWLASPAYNTSHSGIVRYVDNSGIINYDVNDTHGLRPVVKLSDNVYIKKVGNIWKIFNSTNT